MKSSKMLNSLVFMRYAEIFNVQEIFYIQRPIRGLDCQSIINERQGQKCSLRSKILYKCYREYSRPIHNAAEWTKICKFLAFLIYAHALDLQTLFHLPNQCGGRDPITDSIMVQNRQIRLPIDTIRPKKKIHFGALSIVPPF